MIQTSPPLKRRESPKRGKQRIPFTWYQNQLVPQGGLKFGVFRIKGHKFKYVGKGSTHAPGTLRAIPSGVLNRLAKNSLRKPNFHSERVDNVYPYHSNAFREAGVLHPIFPTMGELWKVQDEKWILRNKKFLKSKKKNLFLWIILTLFSASIHRVIDKLRRF